LLKRIINVVVVNIKKLHPLASGFPAETVCLKTFNHLACWKHSLPLLAVLIRELMLDANGKEVAY